jgi:hypothetical protein
MVRELHFTERNKNNDKAKYTSESEVTVADTMKAIMSIFVLFFDRCGAKKRSVTLMPCSRLPVLGRNLSVSRVETSSLLWRWKISKRPTT